MPVPNTFANATTSIPLSQLDNNFATAITIGNTAVQLGNTVTTLNNMTMANVTISSGTATMGNVTLTGDLVPSSSFLRNRIINGDMRIDQRNAGASITPTDLQFATDRWRASLNVASKFSLQQSSTAPTGFTNSLLATSLSAYSVAASDVTGILQPIEGFNVSDFGWGTAGALTVTVSFWVRSSLTGTFGGSLRNSARDRSYPFSYTISAADTWEQKSITIAGDTTGTWLTTNGIGIQIYFSLGAGSTFSGTAGSWSSSNLITVTGATSVVGTNGATFYLTGVQLEVGTAATPFERRQYGQEVALCQRYYCKSYGLAVVPGTGSTGGYAALSGLAGGTGNTRTGIRFPVEMRAAPTLSYWDLAGNASKSSSFASNNTRTDNISSASFSLTDIGTAGFVFNDAGGAGSAGSGAWSSACHWVAAIEL